MSYVLSNDSWHEQSSCTLGCFHCSETCVCNLLSDEEKQIAFCADKKAAAIFFCCRYLVNTTLLWLEFLSYRVLAHQLSAYTEHRITQVV